MLHSPAPDKVQNATIFTRPCLARAQPGRPSITGVDAKERKKTSFCSWPSHPLPAVPTYPRLPARSTQKICRQRYINSCGQPGSFFGAFLWNTVCFPWNWSLLLGLATQKCDYVNVSVDVKRLLQISLCINPAVKWPLQRLEVFSFFSLLPQPLLQLLSNFTQWLILRSSHKANEWRLLCSSLRGAKYDTFALYVAFPISLWCPVRPALLMGQFKHESQKKGAGVSNSDWMIRRLSFLL